MRSAAPPLLPWPKLRYRSCLELSAQLPAAAARETSAASLLRTAPKGNALAAEIKRLETLRAPPQGIAHFNILYVCCLPGRGASGSPALYFEYGRLKETRDSEQQTFDAIAKH